MCIRDSAINDEILEMLLEANGASCTICSNGQEIVDAFASVKPGEYDMILMDCLLYTSIRELQQCEYGYEDYIASLFNIILLLVSRQQQESEKTTTSLSLIHI